MAARPLRADHDHVSLAVLAAIVDLSHNTTVLKTGWFEVTLANIIAIVVILALFAAGLAIQLPGRTGRDAG